MDGEERVHCWQGIAMHVSLYQTGFRKLLFIVYIASDLAISVLEWDFTGNFGGWGTSPQPHCGKMILEESSVI